MDVAAPSGFRCSGFVISSGGASGGESDFLSNNSLQQSARIKLTGMMLMIYRIQGYSESLCQ